MSYITCKTVGDLKKILENIDDDISLVHYYSDMERCGYLPNYTNSFEIIPLWTEERTSWDRFDGGAYTYKVFSLCPTRDNPNKEPDIKALIL